MKKEEWKKLDELLEKEGFGGYYDVIETLKLMCEEIINNKHQNNKIDDDRKNELMDKVNNQKTISDMFDVLMFLIYQFDPDKEIQEANKE